MTKPHGPLHGVKVVACSTAQAGTVPYMLMADLGAEVIKIEVPEEGDNSRGSTVMPGFPSTYFETNNRGVKSVTLNLKTAEGREILQQARRAGRHLRPEFPARRGGEERLRLRGTAARSTRGSSICRSRATAPRAARRAAGHRFDGPGIGRHRARPIRPRASRCAPASSRSPTKPAPSSPLAARSPR